MVSIATLIINLRLLSRAHSNYLAQINIRMNERQEQTADVLGKLTVLGTIVLPMNIITGMWGMNVLVPGQDVDNLYWFWSSKCIMILLQKESLLTSHLRSHGGPVLIRYFMFLHCQKGIRDRIELANAGSLAYRHKIRMSAGVTPLYGKCFMEAIFCRGL